MYQIIKKPLVSEKNSILAENGVYVFEIERDATKTQVKNAVEKLFRVQVDSIRTAQCRTRATRNRLGTSGVRYTKKAMVKLKPGQKIGLFEGT